MPHYMNFWFALNTQKLEISLPPPAFHSCDAPLTAWEIPICYLLLSFRIAFFMKSFLTPYIQVTFFLCFILPVRTSQGP